MEKEITVQVEAGSWYIDVPIWVCDEDDEAAVTRRVEAAVQESGLLWDARPYSFWVEKVVLPADALTFVS